MTGQTAMLIVGALGLFLGACSVLGGALDWEWWMRAPGRLAVLRYGRRFARVHFVVFGLLVLGLSAYYTWDAVAPAERLQPIHMYLVR